jgi:hypothetical protein
MARSLLVVSLLSFLLSLFPLLLIAIADPDASAVALDFARNRKRKRAITKVVCSSVSRHLFGQARALLSEQIGEALGDFAIYSACRAGVAQW